MFERIRSMQSYHIRGVAERQTRGAQNAEGIARAGSNPAAPTIRRQTASGRFFHFKRQKPREGLFHAQKPRRDEVERSYSVDLSPPHGGLFSYLAVHEDGFSHARTGSRPRRTAHGRSLHGRAADRPADRADRGAAPIKPVSMMVGAPSLYKPFFARKALYSRMLLKPSSSPFSSFGSK